jgi:hypothetical protein
MSVLITYLLCENNTEKMWSHLHMTRTSREHNQVHVGFIDPRLALNKLLIWKASDFQRHLF